MENLGTKAEFEKELLRRELRFEQEMNGMRRQTVHLLSEMRRNEEKDATLQAELTNDVSRLQTVLDQSLDQIRGGERRERELQQLLDRTCDQIEQLHVSLDSKDTLVNTSVQNVEHNLKTLKDRLKSLEDMERERMNMNSQVHAKHGEVHPSSDTCLAHSQLEKQLEMLIEVQKQGVTKEKDEEISRLRDKLEDMKEQLRLEKRKEILDERREQNAAAFEIQEREKQKQQLRELEESRREQLGSLERRMREKEKQLETLRGQLDSYRLQWLQQLQDKERERMEGEAKLAKQNQTNEVMLAKLRRDLSTKEDEVSRLRKEVEELQDMQLHERAKRHELQEQHTWTQTYLDKTELSLNKKRDIHRNQMEELLQKLKKAEANVEKLQNSLSKAAQIHRNKKVQFKSEIERLKFQVSLTNGHQKPTKEMNHHSVHYSNSWLSRTLSRPASNQMRLNTYSARTGSQDMVSAARGQNQKYQESSKQMKLPLDADIELEEIFSQAHQRNIKTAKHEANWDSKNPEFKETRGSSGQSFGSTAKHGYSSYRFREKPLSELTPCEKVHVQTRIRANAILRKISDYQNQVVRS